MRNINELISIIKSINLDGTINDKQGVRLQSWVDKNRNLAYELRQVELIKHIDTDLEDSIINDDERESILMHCDRFLKDISDDVAKIYEFNGIIEGIIWNGEVNEPEVYRLKEWMEVNGDTIRGHKPLEALSKIMDDILADGVITENDQEQLLQLLLDCKNYSKFRMKLGYLKEQVRARQNIGIDLIDLIDNKDYVEEIHSKAEVQLKRALNSYTGSCVKDPEVVLISLVLIAMLHYDGNYYENVRVIYKDLYRGYSEQKIEGLIRTILNRYRLDEKERSSRTRIINVALSNAIVPSHYLRSFFEFIYDIYKLNFEYDISNDLYEDFKFVYEGLRSNMLSDGDDVQVNITKKSYKLIKSTKQLITNDKYIDSVIKLSIIIVNLINKKFWNRDVKIFNPYLKQGYDGWVENLKDEKDVIRHRTKSEFRSRWEPKYNLLQNEVYIVPPVHRVKAGYNYYDISVVVRNGDKEVYVNNAPDIREIMGGYQVSVKKIHIEKPLGMITYQLLARNEVIYDSKEKLYRDFLVFDCEGAELQNNTDYFGTAIFCVENDEGVFKPFYITDNYKLASENIRLGAVYVIGNNIFNFSSIIKPGVFGEEWTNHYLIDAALNEKISIYKQVKFLVFEIENTSSFFQVVIDGAGRKLGDFTHTVTAREGVIKYVINLDMVAAGVHTIEVYSLADARKNKILSFTFALDAELDAQSVKIDDGTYMVSVTSGLFESVINKEIKLDDFQEDWLTFERNRRNYIYCIPLDFEIYRIEGEDWHATNRAMWIGDISQDSILDIYGNNADELQVCASTGEVLEEVIKLKKKGRYQQVPIGFLVSYKASYDYVMLLFVKDGRKQRTIFCYNKCILDGEATELNYDPVTKSLDVITRFYGKGQVYFKIEDRRKNEIYKSSYLENGVLESTTELTSFKKYKIIFYEKEKGLSLNKERMLKEYERMFYAWEDFVGRSFRISEVYFDQFVRSKFLRKKHYFNRVYVYFIKKISDDTYTGEVYVKIGCGSFMLDNINPVDIEICSTVMDDTMEISITKDGDGLFLDFEHHGIMNTLYDDSAVDIFSYTIDMNGVEIF